MLVDSHCHLDFNDFEEDFDDDFDDYFSEDDQV